MRKVYNKLVRDKIPEIIRADGKNPVMRILDEDKYTQELIKKLIEETREFEENPSAEELADIKEVLIALCEVMGISAAALEDARRKKAKSNGRFRKRIYLESVEG